MNRLGRRAFIGALALVTPFRTAPRAQSFSVDDFLALSSRLTGFIDLDRQTAGILLRNLLATPGNDAQLARPDAALERDIIVAWYTGVHQVRGEAQLITHAGALQWRALGMSAPGMCIGRFGTWAKRHRNAKAAAAARTAERPRGVANSSDQVGRNLMDHPTRLSWALTAERLFPFRGPLSTAGIESPRAGNWRADHAAFRVQLQNRGREERRPPRLGKPQNGFSTASTPPSSSPRNNVFSKDT